MVKEDLSGQPSWHAEISRPKIRGFSYSKLRITICSILWHHWMVPQSFFRPLWPILLYIETTLTKSRYIHPNIQILQYPSSGSILISYTEMKANQNLINFRIFFCRLKFAYLQTTWVHLSNASHKPVPLSESNVQINSSKRKQFAHGPRTRRKATTSPSDEITLAGNNILQHIPTTCFPPNYSAPSTFVHRPSVIRTPQRIHIPKILVHRLHSAPNPNQNIRSAVTAKTKPRDKIWWRDLDR